MQKSSRYIICFGDCDTARARVLFSGSRIIQLKDINDFSFASKPLQIKQMVLQDMHKLDCCRRCLLLQCSHLPHAFVLFGETYLAQRLLPNLLKCIRSVASYFGHHHVGNLGINDIGERRFPDSSVPINYKVLPSLIDSVAAFFKLALSPRKQVFRRNGCGR